MFTISTITPVYKGEKYLKELINQIKEVKLKWEKQYSELQLVESIFVIDEAKDNSIELLKEISKTEKWVKIIELSKNFGQHSATIAGILHSSGDWVVTLDEDLQHNPKYIIELLRKTLENKKDICYAKSIKSTHNSFIKDKASLLFKKIVSYMSGDNNVNKYNSYRLIRGEIARGASSITGHDSYFDIVLSWFSIRTILHKIPMSDIRNIENINESGYSLFQLFKHGKRMIMTSKIKFLRVGIFIGVFAIFLSILLAIYALYAKIYTPQVLMNQGWTSQILTTVFFGGLVTFLVSILLESFSDVLLSSKGKPTFFVVDRSSDSQLLSIINKI